MIRTGLGRVVAFNWPKYVMAALLLVFGFGVAAFSSGPALVALLLGIAVLIYGVVASLIATWWVYDHRAEELYQAIASEHAAGDPWIMVHAGLDESQGRLDTLIGAAAKRIDVGPASDQSPSLERAHRLMGRDGERWNGTLACETASIGFAVVLFGIHELSPTDSQSLLAELQRVVRVDGTIAIVEHLRDIPNGFVFGPAALHFSTGRRWKTAMSQAGLVKQRAKRVALFVTVFSVKSPGVQA
jgi:hypothetical protein